MAEGFKIVPSDNHNEDNEVFLIDTDDETDWIRVVFELPTFQLSTRWKSGRTLN